MNRFYIFASAAASVMLVSGCHRSGPLAAVVNNQPITMDDYQQYLQAKQEVQVIVDPMKLQSGPNGIPQQPYTGQVVSSLGLQALGDLIEKTIVLQMAKDANVYPSGQDIEAELKSRTDANNTYISNLRQKGFSLEMIRNDIAVDLAEFNLTTQGITVSPQEVDKYIKDHEKEFPFTQPKSVDMTWMIVPDDKTTKGKADDDLKKGGEFSTVAMKYTTFRDVKFPIQDVPAIERQVPALRDVLDPKPPLKTAGDGTTTDWIKVQNSWAKFHINHEVDSHLNPIDDVLKNKVKKALMAEKGKEGKDIRQRIQDRIKSSNIVVMVDQLKGPWNDLMTQLKANQTGAGTQAGAAPANR